jgi:hypothetical protein
LEQLQLDKIKVALSQMNDEYFDKVTEHGTALTEQSARISKEINEHFSKLAVIQLNIIETKRNGYQKLVDNKKKSAFDGIIKENKERIDALGKEKVQAVTALSKLLAELTAIIKQVQTLGGGDKN